MNGERWLAAPGFEGLYDVSDRGRIWSRLLWHGSQGRLLAPYLNKGYPTARLSRDGEIFNVLVHRLVMQAFVGPCPVGQEVRHGPAGKLDSSLPNLCYGTRAENIADRARDGGQIHRGAPGERNSHAKLNPHLAAVIRHRVAAGESQIAVARDLGLGKSTIGRTVRGECWADGLIQQPPEQPQLEAAG